MRLADPALENTDVDIVLATNADEFNIGAFAEPFIGSDLGGVVLPACGELVHENDEVWIAHGDGDAPRIAPFQVKNVFFADLRDAHVGLEFETSTRVRHHLANFYSGAGRDCNGLLAGLRGDVSGDTTRAVAGYLSFCAIGIYETSGDVGV